MAKIGKKTKSVKKKVAASVVKKSAKTKAIKPAKKTGGTQKVPFKERDPSEIAKELADVLGLFVSVKTDWSDLSKECRGVICAEMRNEPEECWISKLGFATIVRATFQVDIGDYGLEFFEECIAYKSCKPADWKVLWYLGENED